MTQPIAGVYAPAGALARLAPGALLLLAITGNNSAFAGHAWHNRTPAIPRTDIALAETIARMAGIDQHAGVHTTIVCGALTSHVCPALDLMLVTESRPRWAMLLDAEAARGKDLRFITGGIDPPLPVESHG